MSIKERYIKKLIEDKIRVGNRNFDEFRPVQIETGVALNAEGSARVRMGNTHVIVGVKMDVREPYPDTPEEGNLIVDAELVPIASPTFEPGPPNEVAIEIARVVDRGIRESKAIDMEKLCIVPKEKVWVVHIDAHALDHDGNLMDACGLGAIAALMNTRMPEWDTENEKVVRDIPFEKRKPLPMKDIPVPVTTSKIADALVVDAELEEEEARDAQITITTTKDNKVCAVQKAGKGFFTVEEVKKAVEFSLGKGKELRKLIK